jgi:hypothetical protein
VKTVPAIPRHQYRRSLKGRWHTGQYDKLLGFMENIYLGDIQQGEHFDRESVWLSEIGEIYTIIRAICNANTVICRCKSTRCTLDNKIKLTEWRCAIHSIPSDEIAL